MLATTRTAEDNRREIDALKAALTRAGSRASILTAAARELDRELREIDALVDAEEDGAAEAWARRPAVKREADRLRALADDARAEEQRILKALHGFGIYPEWTDKAALLDAARERLFEQEARAERAERAQDRRGY